VTACNCKPKPPPKRTLRAWIVPATILVLLPKCPLCIVAYATWIGIGLSVWAATVVRFGVALACIVALAMVIVRAIVVSPRAR